MNNGITLRKNKFGNYEHDETQFVFDKETKDVIGKQDINGEIIKLTIEDIDICKRMSFKFLNQIPEKQKQIHLHHNPLVLNKNIKRF
jgi:hypothetical protein